MYYLRTLSCTDVIFKVKRKHWSLGARLTLGETLKNEIVMTFVPSQVYAEISLVSTSNQCARMYKEASLSSCTL